MARMLADERAKLEDESAIGAPDEPALFGQPSAAAHAFLPEQRRPELRAGNPSAVPPGAGRPGRPGLPSGPSWACNPASGPVPSA